VRSGCDVAPRGLGKETERVA